MEFGNIFCDITVLCYMVYVLLLILSADFFPFEKLSSSIN